MWLEECFDENEKRSYRIIEVLHKTQSNFQKIEILKLANQGITLVLDGHARVFEIDEFVYHEAITYPALSRHFNAESILVIGDGDGGIIRELLKQSTIINIDWVEIDSGVIDACARHLPCFPSAYLYDKRVNLIIADGMQYLAKCDVNYDLIYMSVTAQGDCFCSEPLHNENVYMLLKQRMKLHGIATLSVNEFSPISVRKYTAQYETLRKYFKQISPFYIGLPSFGTNWGFCLCSDVKFKRHGNLNIENLKFYSTAEDSFMFHLPKYLK
jgi:spermidine synthase